MRHTFLFCLILFAPFHVDESAASSITQPPVVVTTGYGQLSIPGAVNRGVYNGNIATGDVDLFTAGAGKRVAVIAVDAFNPTAGSINVFGEVKISGTYYRIHNTVTAVGIGAEALPAFILPYVLEPGESISINSSALGLNISLKLVEFPSTISYYTPKLTTLAASTNTLYTVPAGKSASLQATNGSGLETLRQGNCVISNSTGGSITFSANIVPTGGAVATTNQISATAQTLLNLRANLFNCNQTMTAGDFINVTSNSATAGSFAYVTVYETNN